MAKPLTLMAVHAHPDDESSSTGGVLARYAEEGVTTVVVCCTNGEFGDGPGHIKPQDEGHVPEQVAATRLAELDIACAVLEVSHLEVLGYHDSGMADWDMHDRPDVFWNAPFEDATGRLFALMDRYQPDVVVTYADNPGYNHPDHLQAHRITTAAVEKIGTASKLYYIARRRRDWSRLIERLKEHGIDMPSRPAPDPEIAKAMEALEQQITTSVDVVSKVEQKRNALAAHASQLDESWLGKLPEGLFEEVFGHETFIRASDITGAPTPEDDLFAGLR
jgi:LmbE family N-acetylglucosaminyl deacetylase